MDNDALDRYSVLMSYLQYENTMYWNRGNFFLVASTALFGFFATNLPPLGTSTSWNQVIPLLVVSIAGLYLSFLWGRGIKAGEYWVGHWHNLLKQIEQDAFGDFRLIRSFEPPKKGPPHVSARSIPRRTLGLFYLLWTLLLTYSLVIVALKLIT